MREGLPVVRAVAEVREPERAAAKAPARSSCSAGWPSASRSGASPVAARQPSGAAADARREMRPSRIISLLSVALAVAAAMGPPAAAAPGEGGGAVAGAPAPSGTSGGAAYGQAVPARKRHKRRSSRASKSGMGHRFPVAGAYYFGGARRALRRRARRPHPRGPGHRRRRSARRSSRRTPARSRRRATRHVGAGEYVVLAAPTRATTTSSCTCAPARPPSRWASACAPASASARSAAPATRPARTCTSRSGSAAGTSAATRSTRCRLLKAWA